LCNRVDKAVNRPIPVNTLSGVTAITVTGHVMVLKTDGTVWGWGDNQFGQVGGKRDVIFQPVQLGGL
jgi:alpha-tubulin suppressor-like RCC1 family protein